MVSLLFLTQPNPIGITYFLLALSLYLPLNLKILHSNYSKCNRPDGKYLKSSHAVDHKWIWNQNWNTSVDSSRDDDE